MTRDDGGFTLIEVILVVTIMALLVGVMSASISVGLQASRQTEGTLRVSGDVELLAGRFTEDVASARTVQTTGTGCGGSPFVVLSLQDRGVSSTVTYGVDRTGGVHRIIRTRCDSTTLAQTVASTLGITDPVLVCAPLCSGRPTSVRLSVVLCARNPAGACSEDTTRAIELSSYPRGAA